MPREFLQDPTTRVPASRRGLAIPGVELSVVDGPSRGQVLRVSGGRARIGSAPGNDLVLADQTVSRFHCELTMRDDRVSLRDRGSTNGTFVAGLRLRDGDLPAGALVQLGQSTVRVDVGASTSMLELSQADSFGELIGASAEMRHVYALLERVAPTDATVLVEGETGTGKDVVARSIHRRSSRAAGPYVPVDCGAIPETLFESELFGHVRGAFTGAVSDKRGVFEEAHGGTLFLDEIGELPLALQPKLLRALESRTIRPVGSASAREIDVRVVAATNRPLARSVNEGAFREDLFYRLAVVEVAIPPLRARAEDIAVLANHFFQRFAKSPSPLPSSFLTALQRRSFPGNVRELKNAVERAVSLGLLDEPEHAALPSTPPPPLPAVVRDLVDLGHPLKEAREAWMSQFEETYARAMLERTQGNVTHAAELAGVSRRFLQRLLARRARAR